MKKVNAADPGVELDIVGDGPMRDALESLSDSLHLQDLIHFIGNGAALAILSRIRYFCFAFSVRRTVTVLA